MGKCTCFEQQEYFASVIISIRQSEYLYSACVSDPEGKYNPAVTAGSLITVSNLSTEFTTMSDFPLNLNL